MMNKKGQTAGLVSTLIVIAIAVVVGVVLLQASAQNVGQVRDLVTVENATLGTLVNGTATYITEYKSCTDFKVWNATGDVEVPSAGLTTTNNVVYNGQEAIRVVPNVAAGYKVAASTYDGVCQPLTYEPNAGNRAIAVLIVVMFALAIGVVALTPTLRSGVMDMLGK
jgi:preprotein translocase subunit SecG